MGLDLCSGCTAECRHHRDTNEIIVKCGAYKPPTTNSDRIRAMSDEELAATMMCPNEMGMADIPCDHSDQKNCYRCLLDWLRQPEEEK